MEIAESAVKSSQDLHLLISSCLILAARRAGVHRCCRRCSRATAAAASGFLPRKWRQRLTSLPSHARWGTEGALAAALASGRTGRDGWRTSAATSRERAAALRARNKAGALKFASRRTSFRGSRAGPGAACASRKALHRKARRPARMPPNGNRKRRTLAPKPRRLAAKPRKLAGMPLRLAGGAPKLARAAARRGQPAARARARGGEAGRAVAKWPQCVSTSSSEQTGQRLTR